MSRPNTPEPTINSGARPRRRMDEEISVDNDPRHLRWLLAPKVDEAGEDCHLMRGNRRVFFVFSMVFFGILGFPLTQLPLMRGVPCKPQATRSDWPIPRSVAGGGCSDWRPTFRRASADAAISHSRPALSGPAGGCPAAAVDAVILCGITIACSERLDSEHGTRWVVAESHESGWESPQYEGRRIYKGTR